MRLAEEGLRQPVFLEPSQALILADALDRNGYTTLARETRQIVIDKLKSLGH